MRRSFDIFGEEMVRARGEESVLEKDRSGLYFMLNTLIINPESDQESEPNPKFAVHNLKLT